MRKRPVGLWVVYRASGAAQGPSGVCEQHEWDAMELARPGEHKLIRGGIASEAEAEALARAGVVAAEQAKLLAKKLARRG
jgi:hypothetical protein